VAVVPVSRRPPPAIRRHRAQAWLTGVGGVAALIWAAQGTDLSVANLYRGAANSWAFVFGSAERPSWGFFPPNFARWPLYLEQLLITVKMALWGTALALFGALPLAFWAARNTAPHPLLYHLTRRLLDVMRGLNEFVLALIFVAAVGLGPFPGILALAVHTTGTLGKLFSEDIEGIDPGQLEAVTAAGGRPLQVFVHAVWPQIVPGVVSLTLYRFEANVRSATVLGLIGAGGIGFYLTETLRGFDFKAAGAIVTMILAAVFMLDTLSAALRRRFL
jgi:phosphonate transport system permease protein